MMVMGKGLGMDGFEARAVDFFDRDPGVDVHLISEDDTASALLENIRLEQSSYEIIEQAGFTAALHRCGTDLIGLIVVEGVVDVHCSGGYVERLARDDVMLMVPGQSYRLAAVPGESACRIGRVRYRIDTERAQPLLRLLPPAMVIGQMEPGEIEWHRTLGRLITEYRGDGEVANAAISRRLVEAALLAMIQRYLQRNPRLCTVVPQYGDLVPSLRAMHREPEKTWSVAALARLSGMSRTRFANRFLDSLGETPGRYLTRIRMEKARELLHRSTLPLARIAQRAGYGTDVAFARAFKRAFGMSPSRYRADAS